MWFRERKEETVLLRIVLSHIYFCGTCEAGSSVPARTSGATPHSRRPGLAPLPQLPAVCHLTCVACMYADVSTDLNFLVAVVREASAAAAEQRRHSSCAVPPTSGGRRFMVPQDGGDRSHIRTGGARLMLLEQLLARRSTDSELTTETTTLRHDSAGGNRLSLRLGKMAISSDCGPRGHDCTPWLM